VTSAQAAELLMNTAETAYPALFPGHKTTQSFAPFAFRYYPETGLYIGVVTSASGAYLLNGVYLVGPGFGSLANPTPLGLLTQYVTVTIDPGVTYKTLRISVTAYGQSASVDVPNVPLPASQVDFCAALPTDPNLVAALAHYGGTFALTGCSFTGTAGSFSGNLSIPGYPTTAISVTYTYL
jgi:hypothetical protein